MKHLWIILCVSWIGLAGCGRAKSNLKDAHATSVSDLEKSRRQESTVGRAEPGAATTTTATSEPEREIPVFLVNNLPVFLQAEGLSYAFDRDFPADFRPACVRAMETANKALGRIAFTSVKEPGTFAKQDGYSVISWGKSPDDFETSLLKDCMSGGKTEKECVDLNLAHLAETYLVSITSTGAIVEADIDFDIRKMGFTVTGEKNKADVESVCLHELGHAMGLAHSKDPLSVMFQGGENVVRREFTAQEIADLRAYDQTAKQASK